MNLEVILIDDVTLFQDMIYLCFLGYHTDMCALVVKNHVELQHITICFGLACHLFDFAINLQIMNGFINPPL